MDISDNRPITTCFRCFLITPLLLIASCNEDNYTYNNYTSERAEASRPYDFTTDYNDSGSIRLKWRAMPDVSYKIYGSDDPNFCEDSYIEQELEYAPDESTLLFNNAAPYEYFQLDEPAVGWYFIIVAHHGNGETNTAKTGRLTRFEVENPSSGTFKDFLNNIEVRRCSVGQTYRSERDDCYGEATWFTNAELRVFNTTLTDGWRLPTTSELGSLGMCPEIRNSFISYDENCVLSGVYQGSEWNANQEYFRGEKSIYFDSTALEPFVEQGEPRFFVHNLPVSGYNARLVSDDLKLNVVLVRDL